MEYFDGEKNKLRDSGLFGQSEDWTRKSVIFTTNEWNSPIKTIWGMIRLAFEQISQRLWPARLNLHSSTGVITLILFLRSECEGEKGLCASSRAGLYRYRPLYSYSSMKKCNLKSPFYYHRRGFVIENKTDFNRSPYFMIIFIHVEGLFGLGRIHNNIIYITHCVCVPPVQ